MTTQAQPPTDAEQRATLETANAMLRARVGELETLKDDYRTRWEGCMSDARWLSKELDEAQATIAALTTERDMLMSRLGEAHQALTVGEETA